ncbi:HPr family phosphocarrier protein [Clostridium sp. AM29-11AC]|nr:HPr family phosphocarrier protein [Clostridium sp. AM29-11AC]CBL37057.1 Phosphotransferase system, HPr-related proteins [butyrate-producing bacterium SM4/1]
MPFLPAAGDKRKQRLRRGCDGILYFREEIKAMVEKKIRFLNTNDIIKFCGICQKMQSDIDVGKLGERVSWIDGKSLMGLMTLKIGEKMKLVVNGEDEELSEHFFREYEVDEMYDAVRLEERA